MEFVKFPKISRWGSPFDITEKLDGTNGAVLIRSSSAYDSEAEWINALSDSLAYVWHGDEEYVVSAQSRTRLITVDDDNYGFARWVTENAQTLVEDLGPGTHFGEWWGSKIQRAYGLTNGERYFSLFDRKRYGTLAVDGAWFNTNPLGFLTPKLRLVPLLAWGSEFGEDDLGETLCDLRNNGSWAVDSDPQFDRPEGVVVHFHHNGMRLKYILDK